MNLEYQINHRVLFLETLLNPTLTTDLQPQSWQPKSHLTIELLS